MLFNFSYFFNNYYFICLDLMFLLWRDLGQASLFMLSYYSVRRFFFFLRKFDFFLLFDNECCILLSETTATV